MDYLRGYRVFRDDPAWLTKFAMVAVVIFIGGIIPVAGPLLYGLVLVGWATLALRRAVAGQTSELPRMELDFDYLGKLLGCGLKGYIVRFVWGIPAGLVLGGFFACTYVGFIVSLIGAADSGSGELDPNALFAFLAALAGGSFLLIPVAALLSMPGHVATMRAELTDDMQAGFEFAEVFAITRQLFRPLLVGTLVLAFAQTITMLLGLMLCGLGIYFVIPLNLLLVVHFQAQLYDRYRQLGGKDLLRGPLDFPRR